MRNINSKKLKYCKSVKKGRLPLFTSIALFQIILSRITTSIDVSEQASRYHLLKRF